MKNPIQSRKIAMTAIWHNGLASLHDRGGAELKSLTLQAVVVSAFAFVLRLGGTCKSSPGCSILSAKPPLVETVMIYDGGEH